MDWLEMKSLHFYKILEYKGNLKYNSGGISITKGRIIQKITIKIAYTKGFFYIDVGNQIY